MADLRRQIMNALETHRAASDDELAAVLSKLIGKAARKPAPEYPVGSTNEMRPEDMKGRMDMSEVAAIDKLYTADALEWAARQKQPIIGEQKAKAHYALSPEGSRRFSVLREAHDEKARADAKFKAQHGEVCETCDGTGRIR